MPDPEILKSDVLIIGSGFGGSVSALRLVEKGYSVRVLEAGRRYDKSSLPKTSWDLKKFLWAPKLGLRGIQRITLLKDVMVLAGAGVGGGSLVYANTLYVPPAKFFEDPQWGHITKWQQELAPYYRQAEKMLGVNETPIETPADKVMKQIAADMGRSETYHPTPVGVYFGEAGKVVADPYFGGVGPERSGCTYCGSCMTGCRFGAKNTLDMNYLALAEAGGALVHPDQEVISVKPREQGGYTVVARRPGFGSKQTVYEADQVIFAAGALGTQKLLHRFRRDGHLPNLSERLGDLTRTNSEAILGVSARSYDVDYSTGIAITSSFHPDDQTHIEPVRYGRGSNSMGLLNTVMVDGGGRIPRWLRFLGQCVRHPRTLLRSLSVRRWSERSIIILVMQPLDNSLRTRIKGKRGSRLTTEAGHGEPNPTWIPVGHEVARRAAEIMDGDPGSSIGEVVANTPATAHLIGGCPIGLSSAEGVVDPYHRVFSYPDLHVVDGASVSANLGVNPSLTITAMAERAIALWPNKGDEDVRPGVDEPYRDLAAIAPRSPVVPVGAPGALDLQ